MTIHLSARAMLTTEHSGSSHGQMVLVVDGQAYGPDDIITAKSGPTQARLFARMESAASNQASHGYVREAIKEFGAQGR